MSAVDVRLTSQRAEPLRCLRLLRLFAEVVAVRKLEHGAAFLREVEQLHPEDIEPGTLMSLVVSTMEAAAREAARAGEVAHLCSNFVAIIYEAGRGCTLSCRIPWPIGCLAAEAGTTLDALISGAGERLLAGGSVLCVRLSVSPHEVTVVLSHEDRELLRDLIRRAALPELWIAKAEADLSDPADTVLVRIPS